MRRYNNYIDRKVWDELLIRSQNSTIQTTPDRNLELVSLKLIWILDILHINRNIFFAWTPQDYTDNKSTLIMTRFRQPTIH